MGVGGGIVCGAHPPQCPGGGGAVKTAHTLRLGWRWGRVPRWKGAGALGTGTAPGLSVLRSGPELCLCLVWLLLEGGVVTKSELPSQLCSVGAAFWPRPLHLHLPKERERSAPARF